MGLPLCLTFAFPSLLPRAGTWSWHSKNYRRIVATVCIATYEAKQVAGFEALVNLALVTGLDDKRNCAAPCKALRFLIDANVRGVANLEACGHVNHEHWHCLLTSGD
jgi:hypothetical protein